MVQTLEEVRALEEPRSPLSALKEVIALMSRNAAQGISLCDEQHAMTWLRSGKDEDHVIQSFIDDLIDQDLGAETSIWRAADAVRAILARDSMSVATEDVVLFISLARTSGTRLAVKE